MAEQAKAAECMDKMQRSRGRIFFVMGGLFFGSKLGRREQSVRRKNTKQGSKTALCESIDIQTYDLRSGWRRGEELGGTPAAAEN